MKEKIWGLELNKIYCIDCIEGINKIPDNSVDLVITSPPYNVGKNYGDKVNDLKEKEEYKIWSIKWIREIYRILKKDGRFCLNVADMINRYENPLSLILGKICLDIGFKFYVKIIWIQGDMFQSTAWGSFKSASCPCFINGYENILIFYKQDKKKIENGENDISNSEFKNFVHSIWRFNPETKKSKFEDNHIARFPIELPKRCIKLLSFKGDIVLDPFIGSGTTAMACKYYGRKYIGFEIEEKWFKIANKRLSQEVLT